MNQILVTEKLYITPELRRKKKIYKIEFFLSIFLIIALISVYIYAEYDRNRSEEASQDILEEMQVATEETSKVDKTVAKDNKVLVVFLDNVEEEETEETEEETVPQQEQQPQQQSNPVQATVKTTASGYQYTTTATISIPKIDVNYPILEGVTGSAEETEALLKVSPCKFWGPNVNEVGNYCIVGHNYRNTKFFSKVPTLVVGDTFTVSETSGRSITYQIYDKYTVEPRNVNCTSQLTRGKKEVTLITCTDNSESRVIVKAREVK